MDEQSAIKCYDKHEAETKSCFICKSVHNFSCQWNQVAGGTEVKIINAGYLSRYDLCKFPELFICDHCIEKYIGKPETITGGV